MTEIVESVFRDEWASCDCCGKRFVFRITEQRALAEQGKPIEPRGVCRRCRQGETRVPRPPAAGTAAGTQADNRQAHNGNCRVYVGRLSYDTGEEGLRRLFESVGTVQSAEVIRDRHSGWSRGFAFVEMATWEGAHRAIVTLNGAHLDGRQIKVAEAKPRQSAPPRRDWPTEHR